MRLNTVTRLYSKIAPKTPRVCIVGAGPAGFYAAMQITKNITDVQIDMIEKLPVPFGLIRYGVAPDHPEVKNVINQFTKVALLPNVNYYGNISLGEDIGLDLLRKSYDAVLLSYGAEEDKLLGLEHEDNSNAVAARKFVGWYNGLPSEKDFKVDLSGTTAAVLGQGNVALDVARILLTPVDDLRKTDITEHALAALSESKIKEVYLIGRRGPLQVAFTIKELREQLKLKNCATIWRTTDFEGVEEALASMARPRKRLTELMLKSFKEMNTTEIKNYKFFKPIFFRSPNRFIVNNNQLKGLEFTCNRLVGNSLQEMKVVSTDEKEVIHCDLAIRSIGYKSKSKDDSLVISPHGCVANDNGKVTKLKHDPDLCNVYVAGWLGTGPVGVILHTMGNAFHVAKRICQDLQTTTLTSKGGFEEVRNNLRNNKPIIDWEGWTRIDKYEVEMGKKVGKPREKVCDVEEMINISGSMKAVPEKKSFTG